jgi:alpha-beta hydrolase superfamily lysophospholipase
VADPAAVAAFHRDAGAVDKTSRVYAGKLHELLREDGRGQIFEDVFAWMRARARPDSVAAPTATPAEK